jgi:xanthine/CO dehydrogenase XdhC/CoxF family maturation factor
VFFEVIEPPVPVVIFGAGHDALPLAHFAKALGWQVTVVDGRAATRPETLRARFGDAADALIVCRPEAAPTRVPLDERTAVVVMTHNYQDDCTLVGALLPSPVPYLGVLGPRTRTERILAHLHATGAKWTAAQAERLRAPVGLDIGADNADEIALSVIAEIRAALAGRDAAPLKRRAAPIHDRQNSEHNDGAPPPSLKVRERFTCPLTTSV